MSRKRRTYSFVPRLMIPRSPMAGASPCHHKQPRQRLRLGRRPSRETAMGLIQVFHELNGFPIIIQRAKFTSNANSIAHLLFFDFRGLEATTGNKSPNRRLGPIQGCALHHHSYREKSAGRRTFSGLESSARTDAQRSSLGGDANLRGTNDNPHLCKHRQAGRRRRSSQGVC